MSSKGWLIIGGVAVAAMLGCSIVVVGLDYGAKVSFAWGVPLAALLTSGGLALILYRLHKVHLPAQSPDAGPTRPRSAARHFHSTLVIPAELAARPRPDAKPAP